MAHPLIAISTALGDITIKLRDDLAPRHAELILGLIDGSHYAGCVIYRAETDFVVQGGLRLGRGGTRINELGSVPLEYTGDRAGGLKNVRGTVTMARWEDTGSGDGEWFINLKDSPHLDRTGDAGAAADALILMQVLMLMLTLTRLSGWALGFTAFGEVVSGMEVADAISQLVRLLLLTLILMLILMLMQVLMLTRLLLPLKPTVDEGGMSMLSPPVPFTTTRQAAAAAAQPSPLEKLAAMRKARLKDL